MLFKVADIPALPPLSRAAFLLDLDGTLLDIAPTPDTVIVPPTLRADLATLRDRCSGALAIVTGRPIAQIDALLPGIPTAIAGEHGTAIRHFPNTPPVIAHQPAIPPAWLRAAADLVAAHPGTLLELKAHGFVVHYRAIPAAGDPLRAALLPLLAEQPGAFTLLAAKMAWELRPLGTDKGTAVTALMQDAPFAGRIPIYVGDDVTDEDGITAAEQLDGLGLRVPANFSTPGDVRNWIKDLARKELGGEPPPRSRPR